MTDWTCPHCGQTVHGIANELDLALAKDWHRECLFRATFD